MKDNDMNAAQMIQQHDALREACYELGKKQDHGWLNTAYSNASADDITWIEPDGEFVAVSVSVWTSQTGGSHEPVEFKVNADELEGLVDEKLGALA